MITIYSREGCAYCHQTEQYITKMGGTYRVIDTTNDSVLGNEVAKAALSVNVPVVTIANSPAEFNQDNFYVGWNINKLKKFLGV